MLKKILPLVAALSLATAQSTPAVGEDYDMDCAVILCLAGGFPAGCSSAYSYMIRRITSVPPKPPFGFCAMGNLSPTDFPNNDDPAAHAAMIAYLEGEDAATARTLRSVRAEVSRGYRHCNTGGDDSEQYRCTNMIELNGDGSNLFMGVRGSRHFGYWRRGKRATFLDYEGNPQSLGDAEHWQVVGQKCLYESGEDGRGHYCIPEYGWVPIARSVDE